MILKKPYAFLIKHFKIIHLILLVITSYIAYRFNKILDFFSSYNKSSILVPENAAHNYISFILFIAIIIVIIFGIIMYRLMKKKHKPSSFYLATIIYYILLFIGVVFAYNLINDLSFSTLTQQESRALRDIYTILTVPSVYFIVISLIRGIGFDIKKFNFSKDLEELEIKNEDNEEFEFIVGTDTYKYKRRTRRILRELKYYILENKFFVTIILGSLVVVLLIILFINFNFTNKTYKVGSTIKTDSFIYKINKAYLTNMDKSLKVIHENKVYLILDMTISSTTSKKEILYPENFYLKLKDGNTVKYKTSLSYSFSDLGVTYKGDQIDNKDNHYLLVFEIPKDKTSFRYNLKVYDTSKIKNNTIEKVFKKVKINPTKLQEKPSITTASLNQDLSLGSNLYGNTKIKINSIKKANSYEYSYDSCDSNNQNCTTKYDFLTPSNPSSQTFLIVNFDLTVDNKTNLYYSLSSDELSKGFFDRFAYINYKTAANNISSSVTAINIPNQTNTILLEVTNVINNTSTYNLEIKTRETNYLISQNNS